MANTYSILSRLENSESPYQPYVEILRSRHPKIKKFLQINNAPPTKIPVWKDINDAILYSVIGQMLSVKVSLIIINRLLKKFKTSKRIILWASRTANKTGPLNGVSQRKRKALATWLQYSKNRNKVLQNWHRMTVSELRMEISSMWGFGRWSADMLAIFHLGRMDVWPETDAGIKTAYKKHFGTINENNFKKHIRGCETVFALYLWKSLG